MEISVIVFALVCMRATAVADNDDEVAATNSLGGPDARFGPFDWLDHRSAYYQDFFPTPLLMDDTGLEQDGEFELNALHTAANGQRSTTVTAEFERSFWLLTLDLDVPYERDSGADEVSEGIGDIDLGARCPLYQFVSVDGFFDTTLGVAMEIGVPASSAISMNAEFDPMIFNDLKIGEHFSLQSFFGYSTVTGGGDDGGLQTFEYGFDFAYAVSHKELPLPGVRQFTLMFELNGETELNRSDSGQNSLLGSIGFRLDLKAVGELQPGLGLGFVFPIDSGGNAEVHWGIAASVTMEF